MAVNECIPYYEPGADITGHCDAAVTGKRFVKINNNKQPGSVLTPSGADQTSGGNVRIAHADADGRVFGIAAHDGAIGAKVNVKRGPGLVAPVTAEGAIAAFAEVEVGTAGKAKVLADGTAVGFVIDVAADGADAKVCLY